MKVALRRRGLIRQKQGFELFINLSFNSKLIAT